MHKYLFDSDKKKDVSRKRGSSSSRREVVFQVPKKRKKTTLRLSLVPILTSSRSNSSPTKEDASKFSKLQVSASNFYSTPKTLLEQQYERKISAIVSVAEETFVPLDSHDSHDSHDLRDSPPVMGTGEILESDDLDGNLKIEKNEEFSSQSIPLSLQPITTESLQEALEKEDLLIGLLLECSERLVQEAHSIVCEANDATGVELYYSRIKLALMCLHMLLTRFKHKLNPSLELAINFKLAEIYLQETENIDRAERHVCEASSLAVRHNLDALLIATDLLHYRVLLVSNKSLLLSFFREKLAHYTLRKYTGVCELLSLLRAQSCLSFDIELGLNHLRTLNQNSNGDCHVHILSLLLEASLDIYRGNALQAKSILKKAANKMVASTHPPQLRGLHLLLTLYYYILVGDYLKGKDSSKELSKFISRQKRTEWNSWKANGNITISVSSPDRNSLDFEARWLSPEEFVIQFYFLSAVLLLTSEASHSKAVKVFETCLELINELLEKLTTSKKQKSGYSVRHLTDNIARIIFIRYSVYYYQAWLNIVFKNDFLQVQNIQALLGKSNKEYFSGQELCYYSLLSDRFLYLNAINHLSQGDIWAAKYFFAQVRSNTAKANSKKSLFASSRQVELGIGCECLLGTGDHSELHLYASLHLLLICEYEMYLHSRRLSTGASDNVNIASCRSLLGDLYSEVVPVVEEKRITGIGMADKFFRQTFHLITSVFMSRGEDTLGDSLHLEPSISDHSPLFIKDLIVYLQFQKCTNRKQKAKFATEILELTAVTPFGKYLKCLVKLTETQQMENSADGKSPLPTTLEPTFNDVLNSQVTISDSARRNFNS